MAYFPIRSFQVTHRGPLQDVTIGFRKTGVNIVVGKNNSGKSLLARAINFDLADHAFMQADESHSLEWSVEGLVPSEWLANAPPFLDSSVIGFGVTLAKDRPNSQYAILREFPTAFLGPGAQEREPGRIWVLIANSTTRGAGEISEIARNGAIPSSIPLVSKEFLERVRINIQKPKVHYLSFPRQIMPKVSMRTENVLRPSAENLTNILYDIDGKSRWTVDEISDTMEKLFPGLGRLGISADGQQQASATFTVRDQSQFSTEQLGTGVSEVLALLTQIRVSDPGDIVVLEEPEAGLYPELQQGLLDVLREAAEDRHLVLTTHSPFIFDSLTSDDLVVTLSRLGNVTMARTTSGDVNLALAELGASRFAVLQASAIVIVEGPSDVAIYRQLFKTMLRETGTVLVPSIGGTAQFALSQAMAALPGLTPDRVLILSDRDEAWDNPSRSDRIFLDRREVENYFLDVPDSIAQHLSQRLGEAISGDEVNEKLNVAQENLKGEVLRLRVKHVLKGKVDLNAFRLQSGGTAGPQSPNDICDYYQRGLASVPGLDEVQSTWESVKTEVEERWDTERSALVPGKVALMKLFEDFETTYKSEVDGTAIARILAKNDATTQIRVLEAKLQAFLAVPTSQDR